MRTKVCQEKNASESVFLDAPWALSMGDATFLFAPTYGISPFPPPDGHASRCPTAKMKLWSRILGTSYADFRPCLKMHTLTRAVYRAIFFVSPPERADFLCRRFERHPREAAVSGPDTGRAPAAKKPLIPRAAPAGSSSGLLPQPLRRLPGVELGNIKLQAHLLVFLG